VITGGNETTSGVRAMSYLHTFEVNVIALAGGHHVDESGLIILDCATDLTPSGVVICIIRFHRYGERVGLKSVVGFNHP
jgi:hypothetical protein